jgi:hypothetical protein
MSSAKSMNLWPGETVDSVTEESLSYFGLPLWWYWRLSFFSFLGDTDSFISFRNLSLGNFKASSFFTSKFFGVADI